MTQMRCTHFEDVDRWRCISENQFMEKWDISHQAMRVALGAGIMWDAWRTTYGARIAIRFLYSNGRAQDLWGWFLPVFFRTCDRFFLFWLPTYIQRLFFELILDLFNFINFIYRWHCKKTVYFLKRFSVLMKSMFFLFPVSKLLVFKCSTGWTPPKNRLTNSASFFSVNLW